MNSKIFFGWWLLAGLFAIYVITNGVVLNTLPVFYPALTDAFGWSPDQVTRPAQLLFVVVALCSPFIGALLDRYGARRLMLAGAVLLLAAFVWYSRMGSLGELIGIYFLFALGITAAGIIPSMHLITQWFRQYRGIAVGVLLVGASFGAAIFNQVAGIFIQEGGWRQAVLFLGVAAAVLTILPLLFLVRNRPEDLGLHADGSESLQGSVVTPGYGIPGATPAPLRSFRQILMTPGFYFLLFASGSMWFTIVAVVQHQPLHFKDLGLTVIIKDILSVFFFGAILGKLFFAWLSDHFSKKLTMLSATIILGLGVFLLSRIDGNAGGLLWLYAVLFGIGLSGAFTMIQLLVAEYYAGPSYGKILGTVTMVDTLAGVLGIFVLGKMRTAQGSYQQALWILLVLCLLAAVCVLLLRPPKRHSLPA